jgi:hypothetical protein
VPDKIFGHGPGLADDPVCSAIKEPIQQRRIPRLTAELQRGRDSSVLANEYARLPGKERPQEKYEEIKVSRAGQD